MITSSLPHFSGDLSAFLADLASLSERKPASDLHWLGRSGGPPSDYYPTLLTFRACLLGLKTGKSFFHHELRGRIEMPPELEPSLAVWEYGTTPVWKDGILEEPKYFSFFQEAPLASYNPCHRVKWRAHELLHGAVGFFWHPKITRFEAYLCARINELLPVVHWYAFDEIFRLRCPKHQPVSHRKPTRDNVHRQALRELCPACEAKSRPFWEVDITHTMQEQAILLLQNGLEHYENELAVITEEVETLESISSPRGSIDGSSDSIGYVESHWNRMTAWSFGSWIERYMQSGSDYCETISSLLARNNAVFEQLLGGNVSLSEDEFTWARNRRIAQDIGYRCYLALEWLDPDDAATADAEAVFEPLMEECDQVVATGQIPSRFWDHLSQTTLDVAKYLPERVHAAFPSLGILEQPTTYGSQVHIMEGLSTAFPGLFKVCDELPVEEFCDSEEIYQRGQLAARFSQFVENRDLLTDESREIIRFETWVSAWPHQDRDGELFGGVPEIEDLERIFIMPKEQRQLFVRNNRTLRRATFNGPLLQEILGDYPVGVELLAYYWRKEVVILEATPENLRVINGLEAVSYKPLPEDLERMIEFFEIGLLVYHPPVDRNWKVVF